MRKCPVYSGYPNFNPSIYSISLDYNYYGYYTVVYITGKNFLPPSYGTTYVNFGTTLLTLPIIFYSSSSISFVVPLNAKPGLYNIVVVNVYNNNFSNTISLTTPGTLYYSNSEPYLILEPPTPTT